MKKYTIKGGEKDFKPMEFPCVWFTNELSLKWDVRFGESCLYDMPKDLDVLDWNKGGGVSFHLFSNNKNSLQWAWRSVPSKNKMQLAFYVNVDGSFEVWPCDTLIDPQEDVSVRISEMDGSYRFSIEKNKTTIFKIDYTHPNNRWFCKRTGLWFGGANNQPGPYGGVAPQDMKIWVGLNKE